MGHALECYIWSGAGFNKKHPLCGKGERIRHGRVRILELAKTLIRFGHPYFIDEHETQRLNDNIRR